MLLREHSIIYVERPPVLCILSTNWLEIRIEVYCVFMFLYVHLFVIVIKSFLIPIIGIQVVVLLKFETHVSYVIE